MVDHYALHAGSHRFRSKPPAKKFSDGRCWETRSLGILPGTIAGPNSQYWTWQASNLSPYKATTYVQSCTAIKVNVFQNTPSNLVHCNIGNILWNLPPWTVINFANKKGQLDLKGHLHYFILQEHTAWEPGMGLELLFL